MSEAAEQQDDDILEPQVTETEPKVEGEGEGEGAPPAKPDADELKTAMAELASTVTRAVTPKEEPKVLSQDEKDEMWAVWNPTKTDPDYFRKFLRLNTEMEPAEVERAVKEFLPLFKSMQEGLVRQAVVSARNLYSMDIDKLREELKPTQEYVSTARAEQTRARFFGEYGALDDPKYKPVIDAVARTLADKTFDSEGDYFKALAEGAAGAIKGLIPEFDLGAGKKKTTTTTPKLPRTSVGGSGGSGKSSTKPAETGDAAGEVLD
jgi:hypothetical protein